MKTIFTIDSLSFSFQKKEPSFFDTIALSLPKPGLSCIVGKNGVGKSTLFRILQGLTSNNEHITGTISINGTTYNLTKAADRDALYHASMLLHQNIDSMLATQFTGAQNLTFAEFGSHPSLQLPPNAKTPSPLEQIFQIPLDQPVSMLSGGQKQILALLMVIKKPIQLLLLDEPTAALDTKNSQYVMQCIQTIAREKNIHILCISHDPAIIDTYADHVIHIEQINGKKEFRVT